MFTQRIHDFFENILTALNKLREAFQHGWIPHAPNQRDFKIVTVTFEEPPRDAFKAFVKRTNLLGKTLEIHEVSSALR